VVEIRGLKTLIHGLKIQTNVVIKKKMYFYIIQTKGRVILYTLFLTEEKLLVKKVKFITPKGAHLIILELSGSLCDSLRIHTNDT